MPFQVVNGKLLLRRTKAVSASECCCKPPCPPLEGVSLRYSGGPNGSEYHCCNCAIFKCYADDVFIGAVNLNNYPACDDKEVNLTISAEQAQQIIEARQGSSLPVDCCTINVRLQCDVEQAVERGCAGFFFGGSGCHTSAADLQIRNSDDKLVYDGQCGESTIPVNVCQELKTRFRCNSFSGCASFTTGSNEGYATNEECLAACLDYYACTYDGCAFVQWSTTPVDDYFQGSAACASACQIRYTCDPEIGCNFNGYGLSGDTLTECQATCTIQSYTCTWDGCYPRYDASGAFPDLPSCQESCLERYQCENLEYCWSMGFGTTGMTQAECAEMCVSGSYECTNNGCSPLADASGAFETRAACEAVCLPRYTCHPNWSCSYDGYALTGDTYAECQAACVYAYNCVSNFDGETNYSYCTPVGYQLNGQTYQQCCATEPCASSPYCDGFMRMAPDEPMTPIDAPIAEVTQSSAANSPDIETVFAVNAVPEPVLDPPPSFFGLQPCGPRTARTRAIQLGLPLENSSEAITPAMLSVNPPPWALTHMQFVSAAPAPRPPLPTLEEQSPFGPGTFLSKTLEKIGIKASPTCSCKARARIMNEKGNDWCEENLDLIVSWLREEATKRKLPFVDFAGKLLVKRAIKLSRAALAKAEQQCDAPDTPPLDSDSQAGAG